MVDHEEVIDAINSAIHRRARAKTHKNYVYTLGDFRDRDVLFEVDLLALLNFKLCIFEIKTGSKEKKARKQLEMHKSCLNQLQRELSAKGLFFSEIKTFWVSWKEDKIVNTFTNHELNFVAFLENPIPFLLE